MNWDRVKGNWKQLRGRVRLAWGRLTDDQLAAIAGRQDICAGRLQEAYGVGKEKDEADRQTGAWRQSTREVANDHDAGLDQDLTYKGNQT